MSDYRGDSMVILVVDDEAGVRNSLVQLLQDTHEVITCEDGAEALSLLEKRSVDLLITDQMMPKLTGLELIKKAVGLYPTMSVILMTAYGSVEQAVEAIRSGADDYLTKPFDLDEVEHRVKRIDDLRSWKAEKTAKNGNLQGVTRLIGRSPGVRNAIEFVEKVASAAAPVLLLGASGSGKEVIARAIHESSPRSLRPFIAVNCASLSEQLLESELFGHEKGAFTGATSSKPGLCELAKGGTLFLDEIAELPFPLQAKLLRLLQEKEFYRVGGTRLIKSDARVIAATHQPLKEMIREKNFREDLFFRLNVLSFSMPPLSDRKEDLPALIEFFWARFCRELGKQLTFAPQTLSILTAYAFPGNVRELQNILERLAVLAENKDIILPSALPADVFTAQVAQSVQSSNLAEGLNPALEMLEKSLIVAALQETDYNQVKCASILKITRGALQYKMKKYGLEKTQAA